MKFNAVVAAVAASLVTIVDSSPVPSDPLNLDLCGLLGTDLDLTPQQSLTGEFKIQAQNKDLTGEKNFVGRRVHKDRQPQTEFLYPLDPAKAGEAISFTLQDSVLTEVSGKNVNTPSYIAPYQVPFGPVVPVSVFENKPSPRGKVPFQVRHVCDPETREAIMILEIQPGYNPVDSK